MRWVLLLVASSLVSGCSFSKLWPTAGAVAGGSVGAVVGGPGGAALGAGAGAVSGSLLASERDVKVAQARIEALTRGDVSELVAQELDEAKTNGFFDTLLQEVYGVIKLVALGLAAWLLVPIIYTKYLHKKLKDGK